MSCRWIFTMEGVARSLTVAGDPDGEVLERRDGDDRGSVPDICGDVPI